MINNDCFCISNDLVTVYIMAYKILVYQNPGKWAEIITINVTYCYYSHDFCRFINNTLYLGVWVNYVN